MSTFSTGSIESPGVHARVHVRLLKVCEYDNS